MDKKTSSQYYEFKAGEKIDSKYWAHSQIGKGSFGTVIRAYDFISGNDIALKFLKNSPTFTKTGLLEIERLDLINSHNKNNRYPIIMYLRTMTWRGHFCIVLPLYHYNLYYSIKKNKSNGFSFNAIRRIATQLLECLFFLQHPQIRLIHTDIKPDNVLLVNARTWKIVLIDFGSSLHDPPADENILIQTVFYRSPEIILQLPFSYPIDMWSLGCLLFEIKTGVVLFEETNDVEILRSIMEVCGIPPIKMIRDSPKSHIWFNTKSESYNLKTFSTREKFPPGKRHIEYMLHSHINPNEADSNDVNLFLDLIKRMLIYDSNRRITPIEALRHGFINSKETYRFDVEQEKTKSTDEENSSSNFCFSESMLNANDEDSLNQKIQNIEITDSQSLYKTKSCKSICNIILEDVPNKEKSSIETIQSDNTIMEE